MSQNNTNDNARDGISRRTVLKGTAATSTIAGLGLSGVSVAQEESEAEEQVEESDAARTFLLVGIVGGWQGVGPAEIDARTNPPLRVVEGEEYEVVWINGDDAHHNFNIRNEEGEVVEATEIVTEQGESQTVTFTAEPDMEEYFCAPHPVQMRGPIEFVEPRDVHELTVDVELEDGSPLLADVAITEGADGSIDERFGPYGSFSDVLARGAAEEVGRARFDTLENGTYTVTAWTYGHEEVSEEVTIDGSDEEITLTLSELQPGEPDETFELALREDRWCGLAPEEIAGENNPTLTVTPGETYRVEWTNEIGRKELDEGPTRGEPLPGHNFVAALENYSTILRSEFLDEAGQSQSVEFVAQEVDGQNPRYYMDQSQLNAVGEFQVEDGDHTDRDEADGDGAGSDGDDGRVGDDEDGGMSDDNGEDGGAGTDNGTSEDDGEGYDD